jgi:hypothetical protein
VRTLDFQDEASLNYTTNFFYNMMVLGKPEKYLFKVLSGKTESGVFPVWRRAM